jgi:hypothetical protein
MNDVQKTVNKDLQFKHNPRKITGSQIERLESDLNKFGDLSGVVYCQNNKAYIGGNQRSKIFDGSDITILERFEKHQTDKTVAVGFINWNGNKYSYREVQFTKEEFREACIVANNDGGSFDWDILAREWDKIDLSSYNLDISEFEHLFPHDEELKLANESFEPTASIEYLKFGGYKIPLSETELADLKQKADKYFSINGTLLGFAQTLINYVECN